MESNNSIFEVTDKKEIKLVDRAVAKSFILSVMNSMIGQEYVKFGATRKISGIQEALDKCLDNIGYPKK